MFPVMQSAIVCDNTHVQSSSIEVKAACTYARAKPREFTQNYYYWHGPPPKSPAGVEVSTGGFPWRFER